MDKAIAFKLGVGQRERNRNLIRKAHGGNRRERKVKTNESSKAR